MSLLASSAFHKTLDYEHNSAEFFSFYNIDCLFSNMLLISIWHLIRMAFDSLFLPTRSSWFSKKMELFSLALLSLWALTRISLPVEIPPCTSQLLQSPHLTHFQSHFHRVSFLLQQHHLLPSAPPHPPGKVPLTRWGFHIQEVASKVGPAGWWEVARRKVGKDSRGREKRKYSVRWWQTTAHF